MRYVDYIGRYWAGAEVIYGVIIAMTFTSVLRELPVAPGLVVSSVALTALACCAAWGIADGLFYLWERNYLVRMENRIIASARAPGERDAAVSMIAGQFDDTILRNVPAEQRTRFYHRLAELLADTEGRRRVTPAESAVIVLGTFLRSAVAGLIVVAPFYLIGDPGTALRVSNLLGILLLFGVGALRAIEGGIASRLTTGLGTALIGIIVTVITIVLGG